MRVRTSLTETDNHTLLYRNEGCKENVTSSESSGYRRRCELLNQRLGHSTSTSVPPTARSAQSPQLGGFWSRRAVLSSLVVISTEKRACGQLLQDGRSL